MEGMRIQPAQVTGIKKMEGDEVESFTEDCIGFNRQLEELNDNLDVLDGTLDEMRRKKEVYDVRVKKIRSKMRDMAGRL